MYQKSHKEFEELSKILTENNVEVRIGSNVLANLLKTNRQVTKPILRDIYFVESILRKYNIKEGRIKKTFDREVISFPSYYLELKPKYRKVKDNKHHEVSLQ